MINRFTVILFLSAWLLLGVSRIFTNSPTFDEPVHLKAGQQYLAGDYRFDPIEPPLVRLSAVALAQALRLDNLAPEYLAFYRFLVLAVTGVLLSLLGLLLFSALPAALPLYFSLLLLEPNLSAHSFLFTTDALSAVTVVLLVVIISRYLFNPRNFWLVFSLFALFSLIKIVSFFYLLPFVFIYWLILPRNKKLYGLVITALIIWAVYGFRFAPLVDGGAPLPFGGYLRSIKENLLFASRGHPLYFFGTEFVRGPWYKQPIVLLFKLPLPIILLSLLGLKTWLKNPYSRPLLLLCLLLAAANLSSSLHFGIRHLLPVVLIIVTAAASFTPPPGWGRIALPLLYLLLLFDLTPYLYQPLAYSNQLINRRPYLVLSDSDLDWGQGLPELKWELEKRGINEFQLAYFGNTNPVVYLGRYQRLPDANPVSTLPVVPINPNLPQVVSATCYYYCRYADNPLLKDKHQEIIAKSFILYR